MTEEKYWTNNNVEIRQQRKNKENELKEIKKERDKELNFKPSLKSLIGTKVTHIEQFDNYGQQAYIIVFQNGLKLTAIGDELGNAFEFLTKDEYKNTPVKRNI